MDDNLSPPGGVSRPDPDLPAPEARLIHLVQVGVMPHVGRFRSEDGAGQPRGQRVIVRTARGLEIGEVLAHDGPHGEADGPLLRRMTDQDELLAKRLEQNREAAFKACTRVLLERESPAVLLDVEHLFDGKGLYFHFLGEIDEGVEAITAELAAAYDSEARVGQFAETLEQGCGPGCGTDEAVNGCGSPGGCVSCSIASACATGRSQ